MIWHPDVYHQYAVDRRQQLLADAAAARLAGSVPARTRILQLLRRSPARPDTAAPCGQVGGPLAESA